MAKGDRPTYHFPFGGPNTTDDLWLAESYLLNRMGVITSKEAVSKMRDLMREYARQLDLIMQSNGREQPDETDYQEAALMAALAFELPAEDEGDNDAFDATPAPR